MYVRRIVILNVRANREIRWVLPANRPAAGWHVVVGDNGSGKTSFLRAVALALVGPRTAAQLRQSWDQWLTKGKKFGRIRLELQRDPHFDRYSGKGKTPSGHDVRAGLSFFREDDEVELTGTRDAARHVWGTGEGWFSASYGPLRRFRGGDPQTSSMYYKFPKLGRHLSLFDESAALTECLEWLRELRFKELENDPEGRLLAPLKTFVNQPGFLPFHARLRTITSTAIRFTDGNKADIEIENLSDGYRSILSMTFELIRQLAVTYGPDAVFDPGEPTKVSLPGVVLIDEIDAHLHPTWQRRVGVWFREQFPNIQFIVTSHSPLVCQAAEQGSIFRLPRPGYAEEGSMVQGDDFKRLVYGNVLDAYGTEVFGEAVTSSDQSREYRTRLAELNVKETRRGLTNDERKEQKRLQKILPTAAASMEDGRAENS